MIGPEDDAGGDAAGSVQPADLKASRNAADANTGHARPALSILQYNGQVYACRGSEYGGSKYSRGNYFGPPPAGVAPVDRFLEYLDAAKRHIGKIAHAINVAKGTGGDQRAACALPDEEASGGFPASNLPHIAHAIAGLMIAVECGITDGLLPVDPGQPWKRDPLYVEVLARRGSVPAALAQKDDPDAERVRVAKASTGPTWNEIKEFERLTPLAAGRVVVVRSSYSTRWRCDEDPPFKVGDRVRIVRCPHLPEAEGTEGELTADDGSGDLRWRVVVEPILNWGRVVWCDEIAKVTP